MKTNFLFTFLILFSFNCMSQKWLTVNQKYYNMKYKLPESWSVDGFGEDNDWNAEGSSVCHCAGTINLSSDDSNKIIMVAYPCKEGDIKSENRQKVWSYSFIPSDNKDTIKTKYMTFVRSVSDFTSYDDYYIAERDEAWQLLCDNGNNSFILYFFGSTDEMQKQKDTIMQIIRSFSVAK